MKTIPLPFFSHITSLSPDGSKLLVTDSKKIAIVAVDTGMTLGVIDFTNYENSSLDTGSFVWSPDGTKVAFTENLLQYLKKSNVWVLDTSTMTLRDLTGDGRPGDLIDPTLYKLVDWRPTWVDDHTIAFLSGRDGGTSAYQVNLDGQLTRLFTISSEKIWASRLVWANSIQRFVYDDQDPECSPKHDCGVWTIDRNGNNKGIVTKGALTGDLLFDISPRGDSLVIQSRTGSNVEQEQSVLLDLRTGKSVLLAGSDPIQNGYGGYDQVAAWSPGGQWVAYLASAPGARDAPWIADSQGTRRKRVLNIPGGFQSFGGWAGGRLVGLPAQKTAAVIIYTTPSQAPPDALSPPTFATASAAAQRQQVPTAAPAQAPTTAAAVMAVPTAATQTSEATLKGVIQQVSREMQGAFSSSSPLPLQAGTTDAGYRQLNDRYQKDRGAGVTAEELVALDWGSIDFQDSAHAVATAVDTWDYSFANGTIDRVQSHNRYILVRNEGGWKLDSWQYTD